MPQSTIRSAREISSIDGLDLVAVELLRGLLHVRVVGRERGLELGLVDREERRVGQVDGALLAVARAPVLVARGRLKLGEALEAERLREPDDRRAGGVRPPRQLLRGVEGGLVEMVDDVLPDVLLRARELVEALADLLGEGEGGGAGRVTALWFARGAEFLPRRSVPDLPGRPAAAHRSFSCTASL